jgi:hypothetical protein
LFYQNLSLPSASKLERPLPRNLEHPYNNGFVTLEFTKYGLPKFGPHMTEITINGTNLAKAYNGPWNPVSAILTHKQARKLDLADATNWALQVDAFGDLVNFPNGRVRQSFTPAGNIRPGKIDILDDFGNWVEQTWHHHENGIDLVPIPSGIHNPINHSGGFSAKYGADETIITPETDITSIFNYNPQIN